MDTIFACLRRKVEKVKERETVYRDELMAPKAVGVKKSVRFAVDTEAEKRAKKEKCGCGGNGNGIRVKVKMTKEEATRLLSKCKEGGVLEFKDAARELVALPLNRVCLVSDLHQSSSIRCSCSCS
ncbi:hypothetical protein VNO78_07665 [Psophocarpus tetragonolobus]|uniref:DUF7890 domain-containing protein n=1 Tax=Psophocarpus tetragonolobus TaxID=3891 RepID=A0AAN9SWL0_PSOTE